MTNLIALESGTELAGEFKIDRVLGAGGFGVTYLAHEIALARRVTIKEYFPGDFAARANGLDAVPRSQDCAGDYQWGLERFIAEAQTLAKFDHPNIVRVYRTFNANNTAYMVLHFEEGQSLKSWLKDLGRSPRQKELDRITAPLLDALETIHKANFLHRDIAPDNIIIRQSGAPVLIDFGAARGDIAAHSKTKTVSALVKPGYSPYEQYAETSRQQGPWTDIYALAATLYHAIAGKRPPDSPSRMLNDEIVPAASAAMGSYRETFLAAIDHGLALATDARPQSVAAWRGPLLAPAPKKPGFLARMKAPAGAIAPAGQKKPQSRRGTGAKLPASIVVPPPPDAPGPAGGLLDFVESLKVPKAPPALPAPQPKPPIAKAASKELAKTSVVNAARGVDRPRKRARPMPDVARPRRTLMRSLMVKLAIASCLSGALIAYRDELPRVLIKPQTGGIVTGSIAPAQSRLTLSNKAEFKAHDGPVEAMSLSGDGRLIVTISTDRTLKIWNRDALTPAGAIYMDDGPATSLSVRNNRALTAHADGSINIWDLDKAQRLYRFKRNDASIWAATFLGSEDRIASAGHDWTVALWETASESSPVQLLEGHESAVQAIAADLAGNWLASGGADKTVKLWNLETKDLKRTFRHLPDYVTAIAFTGDGTTIAAGALDGSIRLLPIASAKSLRVMGAHKARISALSFSPNGDFLASASEDGGVRIRSLKQARMFWSLSSLEQGAKALTFDREGRHLLTGGQNGIVTLWSMPEPELAQR